MKVGSVSQMRSLDKRAIEEVGIIEASNGKRQ